MAVTMNSKQRDYLDEAVERRLSSSPEALAFVAYWEERKEPFEVKNLENVQGDERDVVFISVTYDAKIRQNFGPINGQYGWRRLNVLFTRARDKIVVFSSMEAGDISVGPDSPRGAHALKDYLGFAKTGKLDQPFETHRPPDSDFEIAVADFLAQHGYQVSCQVGVAQYYIDLAVRHPQKPGTYLLGVECDGATYHSAKSVRDRDRIRQNVLEDLGWRIHRIWSTDWFKNPVNAQKRLLEAVNKSLQLV